MIVGSTKENLSLEKRVSLTPETAKNIIGLGLQVILEKNYATHLGILDQEYENSGVKIKNTSNEKVKRANFHHTSLNHLTLNKNLGQLYDKSKVELLRSWLCPGNSSFRKVCKPKSFFKF